MSEVLSRYKVENVPIPLIFSDETFNCRGRIIRETCRDLAADIKANGLEFPIHVRPYTARPPYEYQTVSGHRRLTAYILNGETTIPAVIRSDLMDDREARAHNLRENIQRTDLNFLQEAEAVSWFVRSGFNVSQIADKLGKSSGWVEVRRKLLHLPENVQKAAREGTVNQGHITQLWQHRHNPERIATILRTIKERRELGEKVVIIKEDTTIQDFTAAKRPKPHQVTEFLEVLSSNVIRPLELPEYFPARCLAWVMGNISPADLYMSLKRECERLGVDFKPPADVKRIFDGLQKN